MKILIINMYTSKRRFKKMKYRFKRIFKGKIKVVFRHWSDTDKIKKSLKEVKGIILSGSDYRVKSNKRSTVPDEVFKSNIPILGICYGYQYMIGHLGNIKNINSFKGRKYHIYTKKLNITEPFISPKTKRYFYHHDYVTKLPLNWKKELEYKKIIYMSYNPVTKYIGVQFHPEKYIKSGNFFFEKWLNYIL